MKNNKGFTLVEVIAVIALLAVIIIVTVPIITDSGKKTKISVLETKVDNIKKAAVVFAQREDVKITYSQTACDNTTYYPTNPCASVTVGSCECVEFNAGLNEGIKVYDDAGNEKYTYTSSITVQTLLTEGNLEADDKTTGDIKNPVDESKTLNNCTIMLYKKYGKLYAIYATEYKLEKSLTITPEEKLRCWHE